MWQPGWEGVWGKMDTWPGLPPWLGGKASAGQHRRLAGDKGSIAG